MTGKELAEWRVGHDYLQRELAEVLGVSARTVLNWEEGHTRLPGYVPLALKGLLFTHVAGQCRCIRCKGAPDRYSAAAGRVYDPRDLGA